MLFYTDLSRRVPFIFTLVIGSGLHSILTELLCLLLTPHDSLLLVFRPRGASPGKNANFPLIYPPSLHSQIRLVTGLHVIWHTCPLRLPERGSCSSGQGFAIPFFQSVLLRAAPWYSLTLATSGRVRDFHPIASVHAGHTYVKQEFAWFNYPPP